MINIYYLINYITFNNLKMNSTKKVTKGTTGKKTKNQQKTTNNISTSKKAFGTKSN